MVPEEVGKGVGNASKYCMEVGFERRNGTFNNVEAVDIQRDKLEDAVPVINDVATVFGTSFVVEELMFHAFSFGFEAIQDGIVGCETMEIIAQL